MKLTLAANATKFYSYTFTDKYLLLKFKIRLFVAHENIFII